MIAKSQETLKAFKKLIPLVLSKLILTWLFTGLIGAIIGVSIGSSLMGKGEGILLSSVLSMNCFLTYMASFSVNHNIITMSSQFCSYALMMNTQVIIVMSSFLTLIGIKIRSDLFQRVIDEGLFNKRPPNDGFKTKYQIKVKNKRLILNLLKATIAFASLPTFVFGARNELSRDLNAYVGKV